MSAEEFCRWLQGYCELHGELPTDKQWNLIKKHLQLLYVPVVQSAETVTYVPSWPYDSGTTKIC